MSDTQFHNALIVGAGAGLSASLARALAQARASRLRSRRARTERPRCARARDRRAELRLRCQRARCVEKLFADLDAAFGAPEIVIYNASFRTRGPLVELDPAEVERAIAVSAYGGFLVAQQAARRMLPKRRGAILFTGASASVKGYAQSAPFAMGKFALRGLAQSMARELRPRASTSLTW